MTTLNNFLGEIVYSGTDGVISVFNVISGMIGANFDGKQIATVASIVALGDAISMGASDFNSKLGTHTNEKRFQSATATFMSFILFAGIPTLIAILTAKFGIQLSMPIVITGGVISLSILGTWRHYVTGNKGAVYDTVIKTVIPGLVGMLLTHAIGVMFAQENQSTSSIVGP